MDEPAELGEVLAHQGEVMLVVKVADLADPVQAVGVAEPAAESEAGIRGVGDEPTVANQVDHLADRAPLWVHRMHIEVPRHGASLEARGRSVPAELRRCGGEPEQHRRKGFVLM